MKEHGDTVAAQEDPSHPSRIPRAYRTTPNALTPLIVNDRVNIIAGFESPLRH